MRTEAGGRRYGRSLMLSRTLLILPMSRPSYQPSHFFKFTCKRYANQHIHAF